MEDIQTVSSSLQLLAHALSSLQSGKEFHFYLLILLTINIINIRNCHSHFCAQYIVSTSMPSSMALSLQLHWTVTHWEQASHCSVLFYQLQTLQLFTGLRMSVRLVSVGQQSSLETPVTTIK